MSRSPLKISLYFILFLLLLISDTAKGLAALFILLTGAYILASLIYRKVFETATVEKDRGEYTEEFKEAIGDKRPSRDEITGKYSADRYSKEEIENFIDEIGEIAGEDFSEILEVETVREISDKGLMELKDMARKDYEPIFDLKRDDGEIVRVRRNFPERELLEALNEVLDELEGVKKIFLYRDSKILVLDDEEKEALEDKFGSRFRKV